MCILANLHFPPDLELKLPPLKESNLKCVLIDKECDVNAIQENFVNDLPLPFAITCLKEVPVSSATLLCGGEGVKTTVELMLDIDGLNYQFLPGDTIGVCPKNDEKEINVVLKRIGLEINDRYKVEIGGTKKFKLPAHIPSLFSVKYLLESCVELRGVVKKGFLRALAEHTSDPTQKRRIIELCSREGSEEYNKYILKRKSSIIDILLSFSSCQPPLSLLIEHIPRLQPRPYSIASSPLEDAQKLRIIFNIVHDIRNRRGLCSGWLYDVSRPLHDLSSKFSKLEMSSNEKSRVKIPIYLRKPTNFRIPQNISLPLIMIGTGTGITPFVGFLKHRKQQLINSNGKKPENLIFFGCRHDGKDDIYSKMFKSMEEENLCTYCVSYSRDGTNTGSKYVQDLMRAKQTILVDQLLTTETVLFMCGNGLMTDSVTETLIHLIASNQGIKEEEAKCIIMSLEKKGQIVKEVWV